MLEIWKLFPALTYYGGCWEGHLSDGLPRQTACKHIQEEVFLVVFMRWEDPAHSECGSGLFVGGALDCIREEKVN